MMQAVFLVGGLGTRLGEATRNKPKPLLPVGGRPFLDYLIEDVARHGIKDCLFLAQFEADQIREYCDTSPLRARFGLSTNVSTEPPGAGTGGAVWHARDQLAERFLLLNGDSWINGNYLELFRLLEQPGTEGAIALRGVEEACRYGRVALDGDLAVAFTEKDATFAGAGDINAGVYAFRREILSRLTPDCSLERDVLPKLASERRLRATKFGGYFIDIGVPDSLSEAERSFADHFRRPAIFFDRDGVLNRDHGHVGSVDRFEWMPGAIDAIKMANDHGYLTFVVTNQAGVAKGFYDEAAVGSLHAHMQTELSGQGAHIDAFRYCPFHVDGVVPEYARESRHRKPEPGMILDLAAEWSVDMERSLLIGDKASDLEAASRAGLPAQLYDGTEALDRWIKRTGLIPQSPL